VLPHMLYGGWLTRIAGMTLSHDPRGAMKPARACGMNNAMLAPSDMVTSADKAHIANVHCRYRDPMLQIHRLMMRKGGRQECNYCEHARRMKAQQAARHGPNRRSQQAAPAIRCTEALRGGAGAVVLVESAHAEGPQPAARNPPHRSPATSSVFELRKEPWEGPGGASTNPQRRLANTH